MKKYIVSFLIVGLGLISCKNNSSNPIDKSPQDHSHLDKEIDNNVSDGETKKPLSPRRQVMDNIGKTHVHIDYSSPSVRGRIVWNGLVAYDQVWVTGAHKATSIDFSTDVIIDGKEIPKGKYAFFTIPNEKEWVLILNKNTEQHLADDYDEGLDVIRINAKPIKIEETVEALTYEVIPENEKQGKIKISWGKISVELPLESKG